jgi:hypothetical protein
MKLASLLFVFFLSVSIATASTYGYPKKKRPAVSLIEACEIATAMLKSQGKDAQFHAFGTTLRGDREHSGDGAWTIYFSDEAGNETWAYIPLKSNTCSLSYHVSDQSKRPENAPEVKFNREGTKVTVVDKDPGNKK